MPSSPTERRGENLETIKSVSVNMEKINQVREEFLKESRKFEQEESFLSDANAEKEQLYREKFVLIEEMKQVNNDINTLETSCKQSENEKRRAFENSRRLLQELQKLKLETNLLCQELEHENLPETLIATEHEQKFQCASVPAPFEFVSWAVSPVAGPYLDASRHFSSLAVNSDIGVTGPDDYNRGAIMAQMALMTAGASPFVPASLPSLPIGGCDGGDASAASDVSPPTSSMFISKHQQQPPPMKVCNSCQQQIHRNAPICPLCKSKSRSRNPKKPKRKSNNVTSSTAPPH